MTFASLCNWAGRFESYLVATPEDRFCRDVAQYFVQTWKPSSHEKCEQNIVVFNHIYE